LAQQQLYLNPDLEAKALEDLKSTLDPALQRIVAMVKVGIKISVFNPYHQARRDAFADKEKLFYVVNSDIVMILDKADHIIGIQCSDSFHELLDNSVEVKVFDGFRTYSILQPMPLPDSTRHGLHWAEWLRRRPENDFRNPEGDRRRPSGVSHHGSGFMTGRTTGTGKMYVKQDSGERLNAAPEHVRKQYRNVRKSCIGACKEILSFLFEHLEPELFKEYLKVAQELEKRGDPSIMLKTRPYTEIWSLVAVLVDVHTTEHQDVSDWQYSFAGLIPMGDFEGGDLLLREFGLQIVAPAGCAQLIRGREARHSITEYTGHRIVTVNVTHQASKMWAERGEEKPVLSTGGWEQGEKRKHSTSDVESEGMETGESGVPLMAKKRYKDAWRATDKNKM